MLIDCHTHLDNTSDYIKCINATGPKDWAEVEARAKSDQTVVPFFGLHPWYVADRPKDWKTQLEVFLKRNKAGMGEVGLDKGHRDFKAQEKVFEEECELAIAMDRPMMIHAVKSIGSVLGIIKAAGKKTPVRFAVHAFKGSKESIKEIEKLGGYISLSFNTDKETIEAVSPDRILVETDVSSSDLKYMVRMVNTIRGSEYQGIIEDNARAFLKGLIK